MLPGCPRIESRRFPPRRQVNPPTHRGYPAGDRPRRMRAERGDRAREGWRGASDGALPSSRGPTDRHVRLGLSCFGRSIGGSKGGRGDDVGILDNTELLIIFIVMPKPISAKKEGEWGTESAPMCHDGNGRVQGPKMVQFRERRRDLDPTPPEP